jgi:hypothetical protein
MEHTLDLLFIWILMILTLVWWWFIVKTKPVKKYVLYIGISVILTGMFYFLFSMFDLVVFGIITLFGLLVIAYFLFKAITTKT